MSDLVKICQHEERELMHEVLVESPIPSFLISNLSGAELEAFELLPRYCSRHLG